MAQLARAKSTIPTSSRSWESTVLTASMADAWKAVRGCEFGFLSNVTKCQNDGNGVGGLRTITYGDGKTATVQTIEIRELSDLHHYVTYEVISSEPSVEYTSAIHRIRLHNVTYNLSNEKSDTNQVFLEWGTEFSNDASLTEIEDSKFKKLDAFKELQVFLNKNGSKKDEPESKIGK